MNCMRLRSCHAVAIALAAVAISACEKGDKASSTNPTSANPTTTTEPKTAVEPKIQPAPKPEGLAAAPGTAVVTWKDVGLATPESVLHDDAADIYLVSNIEGKPLEADGKAFIARLSPNGTVATLKWIEGGKNKVTLNAPKGMAFLGDRLYVADIDTVRIFNRSTGAPEGDVKIAGATFLNDVATTLDGRVLVSDMGMKAGGKGFEPSGTDAVYAIDKDKKVTPIAKSKDLGGPNGLVATADKTWVVTFGSGEVYSLDAKGKKGDVQKLPKGSLDGIVLLGDEMLISSWDANAIYRGKPGGTFKAVLEEVKSPADIGYDKKRSRLLVPLFNDNEVRAYDVK